MGDKWSLFQTFWRISDDDSPITDASTAEDNVIEDCILRFQAVTKELTDRLAAISAERTSTTEQLRKLQDAVILVYAAACRNDSAEVKQILEEAKLI